MERQPQEFIIRRGDQYALPFTVILGNYFLLKDEVDKIQITVEDCIQKHLYITRDEYGKIIAEEGDVVFDTYRNTFNLPLTQQETFAMTPNMVYKTEVKVRVRKVNADDTPYIYSFEGPSIRVEDSISENIMTL